MNTIGLGNALVDVLLQLDSDDVLTEIRYKEGCNGYDRSGTDDRYP